MLKYLQTNQFNLQNKEIYKTNHFSFKYFYERRIRRILPVLFFIQKAIRTYFTDLLLLVAARKYSVISGASNSCSLFGSQLSRNLPTAPAPKIHPKHNPQSNICRPCPERNESGRRYPSNKANVTAMSNRTTDIHPPFGLAAWFVCFPGICIPLASYTSINAAIWLKHSIFNRASGIDAIL